MLRCSSRLARQASSEGSPLKRVEKPKSDHPFHQTTQARCKKPLGNFLSDTVATASLSPGFSSSPAFRPYSLDVVAEDDGGGGVVEGLGRSKRLGHRRGNLALAVVHHDKRRAKPHALQAARNLASTIMRIQKITRINLFLLCSMQSLNNCQAERSRKGGCVGRPDGFTAPMPTLQTNSSKSTPTSKCFTCISVYSLSQTRSLRQCPPCPANTSSLVVRAG